MPALIGFRGVEVRLGGRAVLSGLNLDVEEGETLVLLGRSGSGKTTALRLVNAMLYPASGEVRVEGRATREWDPIRLRRRIGYVIQEGGLFPHFTVARNVALPAALEQWPAARIGERVREMLSLVNLDPDRYGSRYPRELSGGERQRVGVARALAADPPILLFDEPFGALDPVTRAELQNEFGALARRLRKTVLFVTHDVREALKLGTRIGLMRGGRMEGPTTPGEFLRSQSEEARAFQACMD
ncbi:MAG: ATP-binding cassette domain-containing protein [Bryobacteraceae bacterium]